MSVWPNDYIENVIDDVDKYNPVRRIKKSGLLERLLVRKCSPKRLHPNPDDEFSQEDIGPNLEIVGDYVKEVQRALNHSLPIYDEPVIVQKMEPDGYMLINGHHRWFAAIRMRVNKLRIKVVNIINETDLSRMLEETKNSKLVSFDFDEVLLCQDKNDEAAIVDRLFSRKFKERLRTGAPEVIKLLQEKGYDICVYTSNYFCEEDFIEFFYMYRLKINIVVNGVNEKRKHSKGNAKRLQGMLRDKYKQIIHIDNESVIFTNTVTKEYDVCEFEDPNGSWSENVIRLIQ